jgi:DNA-directed RNA polymerase specialized sigma24 family protein
MIKRRHQQTQELECLDDITRFESEIKGLSAYHEVFEQATLVEECLLSLNTRQRRTVELIHFEGYTLLETAGILKESLANTRNLYYRGMKALRSYLTNASVQSTKKFASRGRGLPVASRDSIILGAD